MAQCWEISLPPRVAWAWGHPSLRTVPHKAATAAPQGWGLPLPPWGSEIRAQEVLDSLKTVFLSVCVKWDSVELAIMYSIASLDKCVHQFYTTHLSVTCLKKLIWRPEAVYEKATRTMRPHSLGAFPSKVVCLAPEVSETSGSDLVSASKFYSFVQWRP